MNDFYQRIRRRFCEIMDWHPVDGDSDKPVSMSLNQSILATREKGGDWWM